MGLAVEEKCEFMPFLAPKEVIVKDSHVTGLVFHRTEQLEDGTWIEDAEQVVRLKSDFIISAFGSGLQDQGSKRINQNIPPFALTFVNRCSERGHGTGQVQPLGFAGSGY